VADAQQKASLAWNWGLLEALMVEVWERVREPATKAKARVWEGARPPAVEAKARAWGKEQGCGEGWAAAIGERMEEQWAAATRRR
jgi:hypothetical protein